MKAQGKRLFLILIAFMMSSCEAVGVSTQETPPGEINAEIGTPSSTPAQLTFPQMTGTAQALPTVVYPTEKPLTPQEFFSLSQSKTTSPDGNYVVTCDYSFPTLFYAPTKTVISTADRYFSCSSQASFWSPDSSYVYLVEGITEDIYRWRVDGSQPEFLEINKVAEPKKLNYPDCTVKMRGSPDGHYLAIQKCDLYVVSPNDESLRKPLMLEECSGCFDDFRWIAPQLLLLVYFNVESIVHIPTGNRLARIIISGGPCAEQIPLMSPDGHWVVSDAPWCGGGAPGPNQSIIANLEDGSERVFSESFADRIDLVSWSPDGSKLYLVSRPTEVEALPDPRTPFGLLAMNPETLQVQNLFEQAWYVSFNKDFSWAYIVFPVKNENGILRLEGALWKADASQLVGQQIMASNLDEKFLEPVPYFTMQPFYSFTGEELGSSSTAAVRPHPAAWSHDNTQIATINADHQLVVINLNGDVQVIGKLKEDQEWLYSEIKWSEDDRSLDVDGVTWPVP
jgi:hypothetical protein